MPRPHRILDTKTMTAPDVSVPVSRILPHPPVHYRHRTHSVRDSFVRVIGASSVAFLTRPTDFADSENHPPLPPSLPPSNPIPHTAELSLPSCLCGYAGVCLVFVIGDRRGIDARVKRAGSSPAGANGGSAIGVARNRPCLSEPVG